MFRDAVKAVTRRDDEDDPPPQRRRSGETGKAFNMTARAILRRAVMLPPEVYGAATSYLAHTLDWMNPYCPDDSSHGGELDHDFDARSNFLSPRL